MPLHKGLDYFSGDKLNRSHIIKHLVWEFLRLFGIALVIKIVAWIIFYSDAYLNFLDSSSILFQTYYVLSFILAVLGVIGLVTWQLQLFLLAVIFFLALRHQSLGILAKIVVILIVYLLLTPISFYFMNILDIHPFTFKWL